MVLRCDSLDTVSIGELKYTRKRFFFFLSMKSNIMKYLPFVLSVVRRFFCIYLEVSNASCFCEKELPHHGPVHFRRRINIEYDTASLDRTDALTMESNFLPTASSNINSDFLGQLQLKSTYFRMLIFCFPSNAMTSCQGSYTQN